MGYEVPIEAAKSRLSELGRMVDAGERVIITKNGVPAYELSSVRKREGFNRAALEAWKRERGYSRLVGPYDGDFDEPLDEDILIKPLG